MDASLKEKYGYCVIPKNALLYRANRGDNSTDQLFFATKYCEAIGWGRQIQIWKIRNPIEVLFLVRSINHDAKGDSSLPDLYYQIFPNEQRKLDDLDVKQDEKRRDSFARKLFNEAGVTGWFTSTENGSTGFEICLFNKERINRDLELIETNENKNHKYWIDTIKRMKFYPTQTFYSESRKKIQNALSFEDKGKNAFRIHTKLVKAWVMDYVERGNSLESSKCLYYDLRLKLKI